MKKIILLFLPLCAVLSLQAQDTTGGLRPNQILLARKSFVYKNNTYGMEQLKGVLSSNQAASTEYARYENGKTLYAIPVVLWLASAAAGLVTLGSGNGMSGKFFAVSFVPLFAAIHISNRAKKHLYSAIDIYNK